MTPLPSLEMRSPAPTGEDHEFLWFSACGLGTIKKRLVTQSVPVLLSCASFLFCFLPSPFDRALNQRFDARAIYFVPLNKVQSLVTSSLHSSRLWATVSAFWLRFDAARSWAEYR